MKILLLLAQQAKVPGPELRKEESLAAEYDPCVTRASGPVSALKDLRLRSQHTCFIRQPLFM